METANESGSPEETDLSITDVFLFGAGAVGKGTLGRILASLRKGLHYIEMSEILNWATLKRPDLISDEENALRARGKLMTDSCAMNCFGEYADFYDLWGKRHIHDGGGRTVHQADKLCTLIKVRRLVPKIVVADLRIGLAEVLARAKHRRETALAEGRTPRFEDSPEIAEARYHEHEANRPDILEEFRKHTSHVHEIDASNSPRVNLLTVIGTLCWTQFGKDGGII